MTVLGIIIIVVIVLLAISWFGGRQTPLATGPAGPYYNPAAIVLLVMLLIVLWLILSGQLSVGFNP
jgi:hypothetical protein